MTEEFQITSREGLPLRGTIHLAAGAPKALALLIHGFKGFRQWGFFPWIAEQLAAVGVTSCRFDMSRNGIGEDPEQFDRLDLFADDTFSTQLADLKHVLHHLRSDPRFASLPLFLLGHSRGGAIAMLSAPNIEDLAGVVVWASIATLERFTAEEIATWRAGRAVTFINARTGQEMSVSPAMFADLEANREALNIESALSRLAPPLLVIHGAADETVSPEESRIIAARAHDSSLLILPGAGHTFGAIHPLVSVPRELRLAFILTSRFILSYA
jgi:alpha-beta hydrolase superfamily lysophospholipase